MRIEIRETAFESNLIRLPDGSGQFVIIASSVSPEGDRVQVTLTPTRDQVRALTARARRALECAGAIAGVVGDGSAGAGEPPDLETGQVSSTAIIAILFAVDIAVHLVVTVVVGRWLNRVARTEVLKASAQVKTALLEALPGAVSVIAAGAREATERERV